MPRAKYRSSILGALLGTLALTLVLAAALAPDLPAAPTAPPAANKPPTGSRGPLPSPSALEAVTLEGLRADLGHPGRRRAALDRLLRASRVDAPRLHEWLHRRTAIAPADYKNVLRHIGAQVPDHHGRFTRPARVEDLDWLEALVALDPDELGSHLRPAYTDTLLTVALMRALSTTRHPDASVSLLRLAYRHNSAFKDECGRQIRAMQVHAVPGLLRARALRDPLAFKMVRYAAYQLDRIDCVRPDRALKQADPDLRAEILHAYGEVRDPSAVQAVLRYTDAPSPRVRRAARWAMLRYVSGRPPRVVKRKLKLPGGKQTAQERALYLTFRQLASHAIVDRLAAELHGAEKGPLEQLKRSLRGEGEPRHLAERLFSLLDRKQQEAGREALTAALKQARSGQLEPALVELDRQLAIDPYHPDRGEIARHYYRQGCVLQQAGRHDRALALLTKSIHLAPRGAFVADARARRARSELAVRPSGSGSPAGGHPAPAPRRGWLAGLIASGLVLALVTALTALRRRLTLQ